MRLNLLHNKVVVDTLSDKFVESFNKNFMPKLRESYPSAEEALIYEDYLSDGLFDGANFYCPVTLIEDGRTFFTFAVWKVDAKRFENSVPYSYIGSELIDFELCTDAPDFIKEKLSGKKPYIPGKHISLRIEAKAPTKTFLSGKYSQSFVDIMVSELTKKIEKEFLIGATEDSSLEFHLVFAPGTFMEHVVDNVTYRRLQLSAKSCSARDLWIKWTRLDGVGSYTLSDNADPLSISFEIAEEVPEKIREKEYRYLIAQESHLSYKTAMSRKNFVEWRELVKRVIKRGEVEKYEEESINAPVQTEEIFAPVTADTAYSAPDSADFNEDISLKLKSVIEGFAEVKEPEPDTEEDINPDLKELLRGLISQENADALDSHESFGQGLELSVPLSDTEETETEAADEAQLLTEDASFCPSEASSSDAELFSLNIAPEETDGLSEDSPEYDAAYNGSNNEAEYLSEDGEENGGNEYGQLAIQESDTIENELNPTPVYSIQAENLQKNELSEFDYDNVRYEREDELLSEIRELKNENEALLSSLAEKEKESLKLLEEIAALRAREVENRREVNALKESIEAKKRAEEREKDRLAEAAKLLVLEQKRLDSERPVEELSQPAPAPQEPSCAVATPILKEESVAPAAWQNEESVAPVSFEKPDVLSEEAVPAVAEPVKQPEEVRYVYKVADISFRHPVDPNITKRIQEIIVTTVKYFGKEDVYMKIRASIPEVNMVRLEFVKIPENESALLSDIIRVLGHSKLGITKVLLD